MRTNKRKNRAYQSMPRSRALLSLPQLTAKTHTHTQTDMFCPLQMESADNPVFRFSTSFFSAAASRRPRNRAHKTHTHVTRVHKQKRNLPPDSDRLSVTHTHTLSPFFLSLSDCTWMYAIKPTYPSIIPFLSLFTPSQNTNNFLIKLCVGVLF